ncbi:MAG: prepilin-type N-terminal cleavage/methylation domain-containing protein [Planctomycetota bacterium]
MARRSGFTLVELVVVVLILGILAAIAVPKIISNADDAAESGVAQTLSAIRDAVELYRTQTNAGGYPQGNAAAIETKLLPLIRGTKFPKVKVGGLNTNTIKVDNTLTVGGTTEGWVYAPTTGQIIINSSSLMKDGVTKYSDL